MPDDFHKAADFREIADLRERARRARYVAHQINDIEAAKGLKRHAEELETRADALEAKYILPPAATVPSGEPPIAGSAAALKPETTPETIADAAPAKSVNKPEPEPGKPEPEPA